MVPAAIMGIDVPKFLSIAEEMVHACGPTVPIEENPGVVLGTILGVLAKQGRDKVTIFTSPDISVLGAWLEQLIAESTGKEGKGLIPVDQELLGKPEVYGNDRVFVYLRLKSAPDILQDAAMELIILAESFSGGKSRRQSRDRSSGLTPSINPTWKRARSPHDS
jgi:transaldolase/glucose-6-phosphate isomerase